MSDNQPHKGVAVWPPAPTAGYDPGPSRPVGAIWRPVHGLSRWFVWLTCATIVLDVITTTLTIVSSANVKQPAFEYLQSSIAGLLNLTMIVTIITFSIWTYRVVANVGALRVEKISATPAWAVGTYFVPIIALFRPYQVMQEAWRASDPSRDFLSDSQNWRRRPAGSIVRWWWACWLLFIASTWAMIIVEGIHEVGHLATLTQIDGLSYADSCVAIMKSIVAIWFVSSLTTRQEEAYRRLTSAAGDR